VRLSPFGTSTALWPIVAGLDDYDDDDDDDGGGDDDDDDDERGAIAIIGREN
jgi:hypothetical protein